MNLSLEKTSQQHVSHLIKHDCYYVMHFLLHCAAFCVILILRLFNALVALLHAWRALATSVLRVSKGFTWKTGRMRDVIIQLHGPWHNPSTWLGILLCYGKSLYGELLEHWNVTFLVRLNPFYANVNLINGATCLYSALVMALEKLHPNPTVTTLGVKEDKR